MRGHTALLQPDARGATSAQVVAAHDQTGRAGLRLVAPGSEPTEATGGPGGATAAGSAGVTPGEETPRASNTFEEFFSVEYPRLLRVMYLVTGNRHEAEEITQDAFVRALERWDRVRAAGNRPGYLYRIAVNLYRSKLRRVARATRKTLRPQPEADPFQAADDRDAIARALVALPEGQREAVVMVEWLGMTDDQVGEILGISPITVRVRIHRARGTMRPILRPDDREDQT
jgi:RNA polymerase sigma-70 factor (ECF subfamily)